jgi:hypothetical protein
MEEHSFTVILRELDTIADFVEYLSAKESFSAERRALVVEGGESNLLGWYLYNQRTFPKECDFQAIGDRIWEEIAQRPEFKFRKKADEDSYTWDHLIEAVIDSRGISTPEPGPHLSNFEIALRTMASENRLARRLLGRAFYEFLEKAKSRRLRSRAAVSLGGTTFVFVFFPSGIPNEHRAAELGCRCIIARDMVGVGETITGIGISECAPSLGSAVDLLYIRIPAWDDEMARHAQRLKLELGYFNKSTVKDVHEDEFPTSRRE